MTIKVAINGFGRVGRSILRALYESGRRAEIAIIAVNELAGAEGIAHLLKYDSSHGRFAWDVRLNNDLLQVGDDNIRLFHQPDISALPGRNWGLILFLIAVGYMAAELMERHILPVAQKRCCFLIRVAMI